MHCGSEEGNSVETDCTTGPVMEPKQPPLTTLARLATIRGTGAPDSGERTRLHSANTIQHTGNSILMSALLAKATPISHQDQEQQHKQKQQQQQQQQQHHDHHTNSSQSSTIGHYELKRTLGKGNFSTVKLAQHKITNHSVAIKIVKFSVLSDENLIKINREIEVLKKLGRHKNIVRLYQVIKTRRYYFLVTEFCANGELYDYIVKNGRLKDRQSYNYFQQILSAVEYLHDHNIVHRDLKAENLLLTDNHETVKIADFGFANYFKQNDPLATWCGSPPYAAPELFNGLRYAGPPVDIWAMGVILYVLICGSLPFDGTTLVFLKRRVLSGKFRIPYFMTTDCESLIKGMLRLDPDRRFSTRQIRAHCWMQRHATAIAASSGTTNSATGGKETPVTKSDTYTSGNINNNNNNNNDNNNNNNITIDNDSNNKRKQISGQRHQSLESDARGNSGNNNNSSMEATSAEESKEVADASMSCLTSSSDADGPGTDTISNLDTRSGTKMISPACMRNLVDTEIVNAVSNMSIDSNNSSASQGMDTTQATFSNHSGCASSLSSSRYSGTPAGRTDSSGANNINTNINNSNNQNTCNVNRQFSKESSIDDQIIDFMVDNLQVADNASKIRQSIANDNFDDLHAMYRLLRDQPDMMLEAKYKLPSLSPSKAASALQRPSITAGILNYAQFISNKNNQSKPATKVSRAEQQAARASFSGYGSRKEDDSSDRQRLNALNYDDLIRITDVVKATYSQNVHQHPNEVNANDRAACATAASGEGTSKEHSGWQVPPQLYLTPPIEAGKGCGSNSSSRTVEHFACFTEDTSGGARQTRHSFDSSIIGASRSNEVSPLATANFGLNRDSLWDSSMLDTQGAPMTPTTPVMMGDSILSAAFSDANSGQDEPIVGLAQNLATITTNLPQIGNYSGAPTSINHNLLLAQLNSAVCNAAMTQSGLLAQHEPVEQTVPLKFTPNNLVNQNYTVLARQNTLKIPGLTNMSLLDPDGLSSGMERRASDGQADYNSLTTSTTTTITTTTSAVDVDKTSQQDAGPKQRVQGDAANVVASQRQSEYRRPSGSSVGAPSSPLASSPLSNRTIPSASMDSASQASMGAHRLSSGISLEQQQQQSSGPLDLSKKTTPNHHHRKSCDTGDTIDGRKRVSTQRSNSTASHSAAVCFKNLFLTTTNPPNGPNVETSQSPATTVSNTGIPFCHASKRAKKLQ